MVLIDEAVDSGARGLMRGEHGLGLTTLSYTAKYCRIQKANKQTSVHRNLK